MVRPKYKPVTPDQRIRELRKEFRHLQTKVEPGPERAQQLAAFVRAAHAERHLNMAMHMATLCLEEDPDPPALLLGAYLPADLDDPEERLRAMVDLADLARYVDAPGIRAYVDEHQRAEAIAWVRSGSEAEQRHRLRTLASMLSREVADGIRDEIQFG
jgi:non-ribosomal peptide synthetase component F